MLFVSSGGFPPPSAAEKGSCAVSGEPKRDAASPAVDMVNVGPARTREDAEEKKLGAGGCE